MVASVEGLFQNAPRRIHCKAPVTAASGLLGLDLGLDDSTSRSRG
ncbi:hypothetical protein WH7805_08967 [Synechococcus sp. WH 7805]|nr:hypothetical protein WH7805_08967 [Synechococcus sp. WH 7805]